MKKNQEKSLKESLGDMIKSYHLEGKMTEAKLRENWTEWMGKSIDKYTVSIQFRKGTLFLKIHSAALKHELQMSKDKLIERLNEELGEERIKDVVLR